MQPGQEARASKAGPRATKTCPASMFDTRHFSLYSGLQKKVKAKIGRLQVRTIIIFQVTNHLKVKTLIKLGDLWVEFNDIRGQSTSFFHRLGGMRVCRQLAISEKRLISSKMSIWTFVILPENHHFQFSYPLIFWCLSNECFG